MKEVYMELAKAHENLGTIYLKLANIHDDKSQIKADTTKLNTVNREMLRESLNEKLKCGNKMEVKKLLRKYNASKLSQIEEKDYKSLYLEVNKL